MPEVAAAPTWVRRAELDGVRGIAVLAVLAYHGGFTWADGGFLGVDLFFVLSGFLITSLLTREFLRTGALDFRRFWIHRVRRLVPALLLLVLGVVVYAWVVAPESQLARLRGDIFATLGSVQNWHQLVTEPLTTSPLTPMWSLAVEIQWYLVWPPVLLVGLRLLRGDVRRMFVAVAIAAGAAAGWAVLVFARGAGHSRIYLGTDARAQALLAGAALGLWVVHRQELSERGRGMVETAGVAGLALWIGLVLVASPRWTPLYRGGFAVVALAGVGVVAAASLPDGTGVGRLLRVRPVAWLGVISYELYLFQWLVIEWLTPDRTGLALWPRFLLQATVSIALAAAAHRFVDGPIQRGALRARRAPVALAAGIAGTVIAALLVTR